MFSAFGRGYGDRDDENVLPMMDGDVSVVVRKALEKKEILINTGLKPEKVEEVKEL